MALTTHNEIINFLSVLGFKMPNSSTNVLSVAIEVLLIKLASPDFSSYTVVKDTAKLLNQTENNIIQRLFHAKKRFIEIYPKHPKITPGEMVYFLAKKFQEMREE